MKIIFIFLLLLLSTTHAQDEDTASSTQTATPNAPPIVVDEAHDGSKQHITNTSAAEQSAKIPKIIKAETKQPTFDLDQPNEQEAHFDKLPPTTSESQLGPSSEIALETQREADLELEKEKEELQDEQSKLNPWIVKQLQGFEQHADGIVTESFQFVLDPDSNYTFRWNPPKTQMLSVSVLVFQILDNGQIMLGHDMEEGEYVQVAMREEGHQTFTTLGTTYVSKVFLINFDTDFKYLRFSSHIPKSVFVVVDLEKTQEVIPKQSVAQDHHFQLPLTKLKAIEQQVQSGEKIREHTYKYEWGFLDNQFAHDSRLLGLTGFQLLVIMSAAVVQLYFIKNLLDNRAVV